MTEPAEREHLHAKLDRLGEPEVAVVGRVVDACLVPVGYDFTNDTWLTAAGWGEVFQTRIRAHHALNPDRAITHMEAALLQGFPEDYRWCGTRASIGRQIGNAVPVELGRSVARALLDALGAAAAERNAR
ncbi:MAG: DNA cytosine methyltransferase [Acidimicrobiales bacterium]